MTEKDRRLKLQKEAVEKMKQLSEKYIKTYGFVKEELPRVSKSTLNALESKGILTKTKGVFGEDGPDYYYWAGKEVE